ncbi:hypothetical protein [Stenotrophobium rhamnosiphilum]|uniref:BIG2 domain-containing protein n=1 Tax=Stenotrophobium rhamnosiphilum TaxID=2029166 RepID=A0A2T5MHE8_9GAMM|nr:hypothetical protein [Stenotrophobium rhamnosiphilum]PTU32006.1 hypothetical protein CJD38_04830 [Stenotrophobium rhamnosiphilum]
MAALRGLRQMFCVLALTALAACNGVGKGDKVDHLLMSSKVGDQVVVLPANVQVLGYQCLRQQLGIIAVFESNTSADFTTRAGTEWTSSSPDIVRVSDGTEPDPTTPGRVFPKGVITPVRAGRAVITADYVGVTTSIEVIVREPESIILSTSQFDSTAAAASPLSIATGSTQQFYAYAKLRDKDDLVVVQNVTGNAEWSTPDDPRNDYIQVTTPVPGSAVGGGLVTGLSPTSGGITVTANFSACPGTRFEYTNTEVKVSGIQSLSVQHNPVFNPAIPLVVGTREALKVIATLHNGDTQDLSLQATLKSIGSTGILAFGGNVATALAVGTTNVVANFKSLVTASPPLTITTQKAVLTNFEILSTDENPVIPTQGFYDHFHSVGTFKQVIDGVDILQDLTHDTVWATSVPADVSIGNAPDTAGVAVSRKPDKTCVTVAAVLSTDTTKTDTTKLGVGVGVTPSTCP